MTYTTTDRARLLEAINNLPATFEVHGIDWRDPQVVAKAYHIRLFHMYTSGKTLERCFLAEPLVQTKVSGGFVDDRWEPPFVITQDGFADFFDDFIKSGAELKVTIHEREMP